MPPSESLTLLREASRSNSATILQEIDLAEEQHRADKDISALEDQIKELQQRLLTSTGELEEAKMRKALANSLSASPIRKLPPEILSRIFQMARKVRIKNPVDVLDSFLEVSWHWRRVALNPTIWSNVGVQYYQHSGDNSHGEGPFTLVSALRIILTRSNDTRLSVSADILPHHPTVSCLDANVFSVFCSHVLRLGDVRILNRRHWDDLVVLLRVMAGGSQRLETLSLSQWEEMPTPESLSDITTFIAPQLQSVALHMAWHPDWLALPWSQLTHLRLGDRDVVPACYSLASCFPVLRQCTELTHCWVHCVDPSPPSPQDDSPFIPQTPILLPKLRFLSVTMTPGHHLFFERLEAPHLTELAYTQAHSSTESMVTFKNWIISSSSILDRLIVDVQREWIRVLDCISTVTDLHLDISVPLLPEDRKVLEALHLSQDSHSTRYMSRLQNLTFAFFDPRQNTPAVRGEVDAAISLVISRCSRASSTSSTDLPSLLHHCCFRIPSTDFQDLRQQIEAGLADCVAEGLDLHVEIQPSKSEFMFYKVNGSTKREL
ncbi:hypothetical protein JAAARDRAFT_206893 [Jaapia argillacea MUCL 33604]|uniref:Uncharacterized protein n=1 Tax=Jaapia argillacea MUCL 33604 TaxID=933084 RepID=A0A067Q6J5_9AGAM|nr:hypothetical protein JAAARDRAFT_206893 [Jaapia argillacea MUCL 33604]